MLWLQINEEEEDSSFSKYRYYKYTRCPFLWTYLLFVKRSRDITYTVLFPKKLGSGFMGKTDVSRKLFVMVANFLDGQKGSSRVFI
jgi:hypothetical protein